MTKNEKKIAENIIGMVEEIKKGIVNAVQKYSSTEALGIDLYTAMMLATADFIATYCETTGLSKVEATKRFTQELPKLVAQATTNDGN
jgi:hypothetical protein